MTISDYLKMTIPSFYIAEDTEGILGHLLDAFAESMENVKTDITGLSNIYDFDLCPESILPELANSLGMEYPSALAEEDLGLVRRLLSIATDIYRVKGSEALIQYLALEIVHEEPTVVEPQDNFFYSWNPAQDPTHESLMTMTPRDETTHVMLVGYNADRTIFLVFPPGSDTDLIAIFEQIIIQYMSVGVHIITKVGT